MDTHLQTNRPIVGVAVVVVKDNKVLIGRDTRKGKDIYGVPGGHWESGESLRECGEREVQEESGITARITGLVSVYDFFREDKDTNYVTIGFAAKYQSGEFKEHIEEGRTHWKWYEPQEALNLNLFPPDKILIERHISGISFE